MANCGLASRRYLSTHASARSADWDEIRIFLALALAEDHQHRWRFAGPDEYSLRCISSLRQIPIECDVSSVSAVPQSHRRNTCPAPSMMRSGLLDPRGVRTQGCAFPIRGRSRLSKHTELYRM